MVPHLPIRHELIRGVVVLQLWPLKITRPATEGYVLWTVLPSREKAAPRSLDTLLLAVSELEKRYHYQLSPLAAGAFEVPFHPSGTQYPAPWVHAACVARLIARMQAPPEPYLALVPVAADATTADRLYYLQNEPLLETTIKLLRLAESPMPHEAELARQRAQEHIDRHGISHELLAQALEQDRTPPCPPRAGMMAVTAAVAILDAVGERHGRLRWSSSLEELWRIWQQAITRYDPTRYGDEATEERLEATKVFQQVQTAFLRVMADRWVRGYAVQDEQHRLTPAQAVVVRDMVRRVLREVCRKELQLHLPIGPEIDQCIDRLATGLRAKAIAKQRLLFDGISTRFSHSRRH